MSNNNTATSTGQPQQSICRYFATTGNCFYGEQCNFLHVADPNVTPSPASGSTPSSAKAGIPCRNIQTYGFCKFQGKGCEFNHDMSALPALPKSEPTTRKAVEKTDIVSQMQGMNLGSDQQTGPGYQPGFTPSPVMYANAPGFTPAAKPVPVQKPQPSMMAPPSQMMPPRNPPFQPQATTNRGTTYYYPEQVPHQASLQYQPSVSLPHTAKAGKRPIASFFMNEDLKNELARKNQLIWAQVEDNRYKDLPKNVHHYHTIYPLDNPTRPTNVVFGFPTSVYKCFSTVDGLPYVIRKVENFRLSNEQALRMGDMWKQIQHPNVVTLSEVFISKDFGDVNSLFFAYHYHPGAETLEERYFTGMNPEQFVPEAVLWSYTCQIISALRAIHAAGLAYKVLLPSKILLTGKNKIRMNCSGVHDVVNFDGNKNVMYYQREDLIGLGRLLLSLACRSLSAIHNPVKSIEYMGSRYSNDLKNFIIFLLKPNTMNYPSVEEIVPMVSGRLLTEIEHLNNYTDLLESDLSKELENGRLFRLLVKLGFINERPEFDMDPSWAETGDRYLLKLLRDHIFHQTYEDYSPVLDFGHVVESLNKLDVGVNEKILLMSRDEQSLLIVSYRELRRCIEEAFGELVSRARKHEQQQQHHHQ